MFYALTAGYVYAELEPESGAARELFAFETELVYTILGTERGKLKAFTEAEHRDGILEFLELVGATNVLAPQGLQRFADSVAPAVTALAAVLADPSEPDAELAHLTPDFDAVARWCGAAIADDARERLPELARELKTKQLRHQGLLPSEPPPPVPPTLGGPGPF